jgi:hypothetical protein
MSQPYNLPATAICPGCDTMVVLPAEPIYEDTPPAICAECGTEVPDYRRPNYVPPAPEHPNGFVMTPPEPTESVPVEEQRYSRRNLFRSLGGIVAEKGIAKVEEVKSRFENEI